MSQESRLAIIDGEGRENIVLEGSRASATIGRDGRAGDLRVNSSVGKPVVRIDGDGEVELGGYGTQGGLRVQDKDGRTALHLTGSGLVAGGNGCDGDVVLKDHTGGVTLKLDGGSANFDLGGHGHNADVRLKSAAGDITLHFDAEKGDVRVRGKAVSLGADHVFSPDHPLHSLGELAAFVQSHRHLPGVPSAGEMAREGVDLGALCIALLEKVEELTLHTIALDARIAELERR